MQSFDSSNFSQSDAEDIVDARKATNAAGEMEVFLTFPFQSVLSSMGYNLPVKIKKSLILARS